MAAVRARVKAEMVSKPNLETILAFVWVGCVWQGGRPFSS